MNVREIEQAARFAWPALEEEELPFGVLRYAAGSDRRANALNLYADADLVPRELIGAAEKFFSDRNSTPVVRLVRADSSSLSSLMAVDRALEARGYEKQSPTLTMLLDLECVSGMTAPVKNKPDRLADMNSWLHAWYTLKGKPLDGIAVHKTVLAKLEPENLLLLNLSAAGAPLSTGMGVLAERAVGIFGVATARDHRRQGYASAVVSSLLQWALRRGARFAYLQVEESNQSAIKLYSKMGFTKIYSYWYRVGTHTIKS